MQLVLRQFDLPLKRVFTIARGSMEVQRALVVELRQDGQQGIRRDGGIGLLRRLAGRGSTSALEQLRPRLEANRLE